MKGWVRCVKDINVLFKEGRFYPITRVPSSYKVVLTDELGTDIGFYINESGFKNNFKFVYSQKRGTRWATRRLQ